MKVLSWDVGIINLAYCLFDVKDDKWEIKDWGIINLTRAMIVEKRNLIRGS